MAGRDDDVDARFAELIAGNFGEEVPARGMREPSSRRPRRRSTGSTALQRPADNPSSLLAAWDAADEVGDPDEGRPEPLPPMERWPLVASAGTVLAVLGVVLGVLAWLGVGMADWVRWFAGVAAVAGLALLIWAALRRRGTPRDPDDDGARV